MASVVEALVQGGKASPGPPLGPALGPLGVNIKDVIDKINEKTKDFVGMQVPVKIIVGNDKSIEVEVGTPPTSALIKKEIGIEKGSGESGTVVVGDLTVTQAAKIARMKKDDILSYDLKAAVKEVIGTCVPMGVTVEGVDPRECQRSIDEGKFDEVLAAEKW
ncbi:MAG: 50S ribosomal protein L11 [Methanosarcinaceae archaeon]|nr:50S ribosomal protein L11 [Methanosarcinaceae archaeon]MCL7410397.1 50S ribosomal protein L11 [Methanosarcinaceae archaeon]MDF1532992.1 50S ribosomal protein L11 [Methanosarcinaceae archaeon]